ncbi:MAG: 50S ribosomal protein L29 [Vicinamibacteria bacterium]
MKIDKIRELRGDELDQRVGELEEEIFRARIQKETGQLDQMGKVRNLRRELAQVKTILRQRRLGTSGSTG